MYRLTPVDAYQENLVKHIEVASITSEDASTKPYIKLLSVSDKNNVYKCKIEIYVKDRNGSISKKTVTARTNDDIWELSNEVDYYRSSNYIINDIDCFSGEESITLANGDCINLGDAIGEIDQSAIKKAQIRQTIELHLNKELHYLSRGIKVLSLFFIDEVAKYRDYDADDEKGDYAKWFEEEYRRLISLPKYKKLLEEYGDYIRTDPSVVHEGYFSKDKKGRLTNSRGEGTTDADETTYQLIMKDKERLLSFEEPIRFIFSHSALKEGWDNPNVFQVCTLIETRDTMTKRQKVGRGLRICVDKDGNRVLDERYNILSVIANESYKDFATSLQHELETDNFKFGRIETVSFSGISVKQADGSRYELNQEDSQAIYTYLAENDYLNNKGNSKGKMTPKYYQDVRNNAFQLPDRYESFTEKVVLRINSLSKEIEIKDAYAKIPVKINKEVKLSPEFKSLWEKIKHKTKYCINMDIEKLKKEATEQIRSMPHIKADQIDGEITSIDITKAGVEKKSSQLKQLGAISEFEQIDYPDFIRRLQDATGLLRKTIIDIIVASGRLHDFYVNPEECIKQVSKILLAVKKENLTEGIRYIKTESFYEQDLIFNDEGLYGYKDRNVIETPSQKNIFDHVIYDSNVEKQFAEDAEYDDDVILYAKLPDSFKIDTPIGTYNPDWAVVMNTESGEKLYFVAETKGTDNINDLKGSEKKKIFCGRKHFEVIDSGVKYEVVKELKGLKNKD